MPTGRSQKVGAGTGTPLFNSPSFSSGCHRHQNRQAFKDLLGFRRAGQGEPQSRAGGTQNQAEGTEERLCKCFQTPGIQARGLIWAAVSRGPFYEVSTARKPAWSPGSNRPQASVSLDLPVL